MERQSIAQDLLERLACPHDAAPLALRAGWLVCADGHVFPVVDGVPVLLRDDVPPTLAIASASLAAARAAVSGEDCGAPYYPETLALSQAQRQAVAAASAQRVDPVASYLVAATSGLMYADLVGRLVAYPIPELRLGAGFGAWLLDVGCSWGRWSIAASGKGFRVVSLDPSLGAVLAARRIARQLGLGLHGVVADARHLPFLPGTFDNVFSYSVLQHFSRADARAALAEFGRVLRAHGSALVQMPNRWGVRCLYHQLRRGFREADAFEVRYWSLPELEATFARLIGPSRISVDCYFGLGLQASDAELLCRTRRGLVRASEGLRLAAARVPLLRELADSVYVESLRS